MGRNWILFSRSEQGRKRYATRRVSIEPSEAGVSSAPSKMAGGEDEARGVLDEPSILKSQDWVGKSPIISPDSRSEPAHLQQGIFHAVNADNSRPIQARIVP